MSLNFPVSVTVALPEEVSTMLAEIAEIKVVPTKICNADEYTTYGEQMKKIKGFAKKIDDARKDMTRPLDSSKKEIMAHFSPAETVLADAERAIKKAMLDFAEEQEKIRRMEQAKAEEEARKQREKLEAQAAKAAESGKEEKAEALQELAASVVARDVAPPVAVVAGINTRVTYSAEVDSLPALIIAIAARHIMQRAAFDMTKVNAILMQAMQNPVPDLAVIPDMKFLNSQAKSLKGSFNYPGCRAVEGKTLSSRSA